jgi:hypothetical protein
MSAVSQITNEALNAGAHPAVLALAQKMLGQKDYIGWCQSFVEKMGGTTSGGTAYQAWQNAQNKVTGTKGMQPGDLVYFSPNQGNNNDGHTGIYAGNNQFISATDSGIMNNDLNNWQTATGQKMLGYVPQGARQPQQSTQQQPQKQPVQQAPAYTPVQMQAPAPQAPISTQQTPMSVSAQNPLSTTNPLAGNPLMKGIL